MPSSPTSLAATRGALPCVSRPVALAISGIRLTAVAALGIAVLCLGACTDEPSESEMYQAISKKVSEQKEEASRQGRFVEAEPNITKFNKIGCTLAAAKPGYNCSFVVYVDGVKKPKNNLRFYKNEGGNITVTLD